VNVRKKNVRQAVNELIFDCQVDGVAEELLEQLRSALIDRLRTETCAVRLRIQLEFLSNTNDHDLVS